ARAAARVWVPARAPERARAWLRASVRRWRSLLRRRLRRTLRVGSWSFAPRHVSSCFFVLEKSRVCVTLEGILPQLCELFQTGEGAWQQASLDHARFTAHPDVRDVLAARGIDEMRHRVVAGRELGRAQRDGHEVGALSRDDRARDAVDAERLRSAQR